LLNVRGLRWSGDEDAECLASNVDPLVSHVEIGHNRRAVEHDHDVLGEEYRGSRAEAVSWFSGNVTRVVVV
jgi:hypothetical protein